MTCPRSLTAVAVASVLLAGLGSTAGAQMAVPTGRETLRGLPGVEVIVEPVPPELEAVGVTSGALRADVTGQLTDAGIRVYASQGENPPLAQAYLYIHVNALRLDDSGRLALALLVQVRQAVDSVAGPTRIVDAVTWDAHNVLALPAGDLSGLRQELGLFVEQFIDDWQAVH